MAPGKLKTIIASGDGETLEVKETTGQRVAACETPCAYVAAYRFWYNTQPKAEGGRNDA